MLGPHTTISPTPLLLFLTSFFQKQTMHLQLCLFFLHSFCILFVLTGLLRYNLWHFLLFSLFNVIFFSVQCYHSLIISYKGEICKIVSYSLFPISRAGFFSALKTTGKEHY